MAAYTPPEPPSYSGDPIADVLIAFGWLAQFFAVRAPIMRAVAAVVKDTATRVP